MIAIAVKGEMKMKMKTTTASGETGLRWRCGSVEGACEESRVEKTSQTGTNILDQA